MRSTPSSCEILLVSSAGWRSDRRRAGLHTGDLHGRTRARTPQEGRALQASGEHPDFRIQQCRPHPCRIGGATRARCDAPRAAITRERGVHRTVSSVRASPHLELPTCDPLSRADRASPAKRMSPITAKPSQILGSPHRACPGRRGPVSQGSKHLPWS